RHGHREQPDRLRLPERPQRGRAAQPELVRGAGELSRDPGTVRRPLAQAAIGLALVLGACQRAPEVPPPVVNHAAEARKAIAAQQWAVAADHLRAADRKSTRLNSVTFRSRMPSSA